LDFLVHEGSKVTREKEVLLGNRAKREKMAMRG